MIFRDMIQKVFYARVLMLLKCRGKNLILSRGGVIKRPQELEIGSNVFISRNFHISARSMKIGNNVMIGPNFLAECDDHIFDRVGVTMFSISGTRNIAPIAIENDVWIGGNVTLLKGVTISEGCVIGAGSIVTKSMPPYSICIGTPCQPYKPRFKVSDLDDHLKKVQSKMTLTSVLDQWKQAGFEF